MPTKIMFSVILSANLYSKTVKRLDVVTFFGFYFFIIFIISCMRGSLAMASLANSLISML